MLVAVIEKRLGIRLWDQDIYINVVGGLDVDEPAADLGIVAAILSSFLNRAVPESTVLFGEIGLNGEIRSGLHAEMRILEASSLGFETGIVPPKTSGGPCAEFTTTPVDNLRQAVDVLFGAIE
jgi:DNA repair protein RadA/Sms